MISVYLASSFTRRDTSGFDKQLSEMKDILDRMQQEQS